MALDLDAFNAHGFAIVREALPDQALHACLKAWRSLPTRALHYNPVEVDSPASGPLHELPREPALIDIAQAAFGPDIALYNHRFVVKDRLAGRAAVFAHQDTGYHVGFPRKASLFVALTPMTPENGGMILYPGTHSYGYLGDAGEIAPYFLDEHPHVSPTLQPGDALLMNSALWHGSHPCVDGTDRIMADIIYQPADDPSGIELLRGQWRCTPKTFLRGGDLFKRSRTSRLKELQADSDKWQFVMKHGLVWADEDFDHDNATCLLGRVAGEHADTFIKKRMGK